MKALQHLLTRVCQGRLGVRAAESPNRGNRRRPRLECLEDRSLMALFLATEFPNPIMPAQSVIDLTTGPGGNIWYTATISDLVGRVTPNGTFVGATAVPAGSHPYSITSGSDGNLWFTEIATNKIGHISTSGALFPEISLPAGSSPMGITAGPDGNIWFVESFADKIGRVTTAGVLLPPISLPLGSAPNYITAGPDGNLWFTEHLTNKIGRVTPAGVLLPEISLPAGSGPLDIVAGTDGNIWFTENDSNKVGHVTTSGVLLPEIPGAAGSNVTMITAAPDGGVYFTEPKAGLIGRVIPGVGTSETPAATGGGPFGITTGLDGNVYFGDANLRKLGLVITGNYLTGSIDPASIHGANGMDLLSNVSTPTFSGKSKGGAWVTIVAQGLHHLTTPAAIATTITSSIGTWSVSTPLALPDDTYKFTAVAVDFYGGGLSPAAAMTMGSQAVQIVTTAPVITSAVYNAKSGQIILKFQDAVGLDANSVSALSNYQLSNSVTVSAVSTSTTGTSTQVVLKLAFPNKKKKPSKLTLHVVSGGLRNRAGSALDGEFKGKVPTGDGQAGGDFLAKLPLKLAKK